MLRWTLLQRTFHLFLRLDRFLLLSLARLTGRVLSAEETRERRPCRGQEPMGVSLKNVGVGNATLALMSWFRVPGFALVTRRLRFGLVMATRLFLEMVLYVLRASGRVQRAPGRTCSMKITPAKFPHLTQL